MPRTIEELTDVDDPAWPMLMEAVRESPVDVVVLPIEAEAGLVVLDRLQVTTRSVMGALALNCGGLLVDHGWLRILGGGAPGLPDLAEANNLAEQGIEPVPPPWMLVAIDVLGGRFAVDGGGLGLELGKVCYFSPDTLRWESLEIGHGEFVHAMLTGAASKFYAQLRWTGWERDCEELPVDEGFSLNPPPFTVEGHDPDAVSRRAVPIKELFVFYDETAQQLDSPVGRLIAQRYRFTPARPPAETPPAKAPSTRTPLA